MYVSFILHACKQFSDKYCRNTHSTIISLSFKVSTSFLLTCINVSLFCLHIHQTSLSVSVWLFLTSYGSCSIDTTGPIRLDKELELPVVIIPVQDHRGSLGSKGILWDKTGEVINKDSSHNMNTLL